MKTEAVDRLLEYGTRRIPYQLRFSGRKRLRIVVRPDLTVRVDAPLGFSEGEIAAAVRSKAPWVVRQLDELTDYLPLPTPHQYVSGQTVAYLGRQYRLRVSEGLPEPAKLKGRFLEVTVKDKMAVPAIKRAVVAWYRVRAEAVFRKRLDACLQVASRHGATEPDLVIRQMRTRWGSCTAKGRITLNLHLVQVPVHCIDYVIMHELCHTVEHNHSPAFYRLLTRCMPDWERRKALLKEFSVTPF
jgi:hypothetical protein